MEVVGPEPIAWDPVLARFPEVGWACGYGSAVVPQSGDVYDVSKPKMVDTIFVVKDVAEWHRVNMEEHNNTEDYSFFANAIGHRGIAFLQGAFGGEMWYNAMVPMPVGPDGSKMKYGVISEQSMLRDLTEWTSLYAAGRLHKPVEVLRSSMPAVDAACGLNRFMGLSAALLLLTGERRALWSPRRASWLRGEGLDPSDHWRRASLRSVLRAVCALSYYGDFRMVVGEDLSKIDRIVDGNGPHLLDVYRPWLEHCPLISVLPEDPAAWQLSDPVAARSGDVLRAIGVRAAPWHLSPDEHKRVRTEFAGATKRYLGGVVARAALQQAGKGLLSAGVRRAASYAGDKLGKFLRSALRRG